MLLTTKSSLPAATSLASNTNGHQNLSCPEMTDFLYKIHFEFTVLQTALGYPLHVAPVHAASEADGGQEGQHGFPCRSVCQK